GDSKWITGEQARSYAHRLRAQHDAVLVGVGTVLADKPALNCRGMPDEGLQIKQPHRVILDSTARTPLDGPLWSTAGGPVTVACRATAPRERLAALRAKGADILEIQAGTGLLPLREVLAALTQRGALSVLVEGGSQVLGSVLDERLADMAYVFVAPRVIGGRESVPAVGGSGVARIAEARELQSVAVHTLGRDVLISGVLSTWEWERPAVTA
ncbi:MAG: RibD family protein, partial [Planctomycetota bacterium]|nr:RibD family protein [Planctomycetota bacterium]